MAFLDQDGLSVVLSSLKTKLTELYNTLYASINHNHSYTDLTDKPTIDTALSNTSTNAVQNKAIYTELGKKVNTSDIKDNLTSTDTNKPLSAAQGKALKDAIDGITTDIGNLGGGDMMKATYDTNGNGIVDNAEKLDGQAASYYENVYYCAAQLSTTGSGTWETTVTGKSTGSSKPDWITDKTVLVVKFSEAKGLSVVPKLKVNGWTASILGLDGTASAQTTGWNPNQAILFSFDGGNWRQLTPAFASFGLYGIIKFTDTVSTSEDYKALTSYKTGQAINAAKQEITNLIPTHLSTLNDDSTHRTITDAERTAWNAKSDFSGSFNDLTDKPIIDEALSVASTNAVQNKAVAEFADSMTTAIDEVLAEVDKKSDFSGSYNDLTNKPTIPTNNNQLTNGAGYQTETQVNNLIKTAVAKVVTYGESLAFASLTGKNVAANAYLMYNITDEFTTTADFKEGAGKKCPAGTNVVVVPNGSGYVFDLFYGAFEVPALTATEINAAFTAAGY